jgi:hypothetical protein
LLDLLVCMWSVDGNILTGATRSIGTGIYLYGILFTTNPKILILLCAPLIVTL